MSSPASLPHVALVLGARYTLTAAQGTYSLSGQDASLYKSYGPMFLPHMGLLRGASTGRVLLADSGTFTISGQDASSSHGYAVTAATGTYLVVGSDALADHEVTAAQGALSIAGQDASLHRGYVLAAAQGTHTLAGQDATLISTGAFALSAATGLFSLAGQDATLTQASATPVVAESSQLVRVRQLSWEEICRRSWGKDWTKREIAYEFSNGRKFEDALVGGPYDPEHFDD